MNEFATIVGAILSAVTLVTLVGGWLWLYLGRRVRLARRLRRVVPGVHVDYLQSILGVPVSRAHIDVGGEIATWAERDAYIDVQTFESGLVKVASITTRRRSFAPTLYPGFTISADGASLEVRLGRTAFADLPGAPSWLRGSLGVRRFFYEECHYYGNPGLNQQYVYGVIDAGHVPVGTKYMVDTLRNFPNGLEAGQLPSSGDADVATLLGTTELAAARRKAKATH